jgi:hypothetical protein
MLGFFFFLILLLWSEGEMEEETAAQFNKASFGHLLLRWSRGASGHPPAGHGGEGRAQATAACSGEKIWWRACWISEVSDSLLPPAGRGGGERKFEVALLLVL